MNGFEKPQKVTGLDLAFGGKMEELLPKYDDIPDEFKSGSNNPYVRWQRLWFFKGLKEDQIPKPKNGIDMNDSIKHLRAIQASWSPKHEHKEAGVAYLASLWLEVPTAGI